MTKIIFENIRGRFEKGENPTGLINEMERIFKIPLLNSEKFNQENEDVIKLYRKISDSRNL